MKAATLNSIGIAFKGKGAYDQALKYLKEALEIYKITIGQNHPDTSRTLNNIGGAFNSKGEYD